jgi:hypothetical protein
MCQNKALAGITKSVMITCSLRIAARLRADVTPIPRQVRVELSTLLRMSHPAQRFAAPVLDYGLIFVEMAPAGKILRLASALSAIVLGRKLIASASRTRPAGSARDDMPTATGTPRQDRSC